MAFEYLISKVIDISTEVDAWGHRVVVLQFKYIRFALTLDDAEKTADLIEALAGKRPERQGAPPPALPKFYKEG